jgi:uncharacterized membrane protein
MNWPNDWKIRDCLLLCGGLTLAQVLLTVLASAGLEVPVIHQVIGFIFLTFVPGILLLRVFKVHGIHVVEGMAYSVGLSLMLVMFSDALITFLLPPFHIQRPITVLPILSTLVVEIAALLVAAWFRDRNYRSSVDRQHKHQKPDVNSVLFLLAVLLLVIAGVKISDLTGNNWALIASLLLIAAIVVLAAFKRFITTAAYPAALFFISLGLLYQTSLMTPYLIGTDVYTEYSYYQATISAGMWNYAIPNPVNSCLSIVMLAPSYSFMLGVDGVSVFKAVYPILFSFVPLIMFRFMRIQIGALPAFLSVFFFMAVPTFSLEMISLCRQQIAELFFALFILLLVDRKVGNLPRVLMMVLFSLSILVSHYSLSFITLIYLALLAPLVILLKSGFFLRIWSWMTSWSGGLPAEYRKPGAGSLPVILLIIPVVTYYILGLAWYLLVAGGVNFGMLSSLWTSQSSAINPTTMALNATAGSGDLLIQAALGRDFFNVTWQGQVFRAWQYMTQLFIIIGCLRLLLMPKGLKFRIEYVAVCFLSVAMLAACVKLPNFSSAFNTTRWYHVLLITLAPFFIIGGETVLQLLRHLWRKIIKRTGEAMENSPVYLRIVTAAVMVPYFVITSGILYEVTGMQETARIEAPFSISLSSHRLDLMGNFSIQDDHAARWLASASNSASLVYCDIHTWKILLWNGFPGSMPAVTAATKPDRGDLLFLTAWNTSHNQMTFSLGYPGLRSHSDLSAFVNGDGQNPWKERIYSNGAAQILGDHH